MKVFYIIAIFIALGLLYTLAESIERFEGNDTQHPENKSMKKDDLIDTYDRDDTGVTTKQQESIPECNYSDYTHKSQMPNMSKYILKTQIPVCPTIPDMDKYVLKSSIPPCHMENPLSEISPFSFPVETIGVDPMDLI
jgi:hypothetical protein